METLSLPALLMADPALALGVATRMTAAVAGGGLAFFPQLDPKLGGVAALALTAAALPLAAVAVAPLGEGRAVVPLDVLPLDVLPLVAGEAVVGLGLGLVVAVAFAAAAWAGGILGSVSGLTWADDFTPDAPAGEGGAARLATWLAVAGFLTAGGHLAVVAGLVDSTGRLPVGGLAVADRAAWIELLAATPTAAVMLAMSLAAPALVAVLTFHVTAAICLRSVRFASGPGLIQAAAAVVLLAAVIHGTATWTTGFASAVREPIERSLLELRP
ncbi:MAG: flagellar biosynthetic protein FliR [Pirellulales bacterium]